MRPWTPTVCAAPLVRDHPPDRGPGPGDGAARVGAHFVAPLSRLGHGWLCRARRGDSRCHGDQPQDPAHRPPGHPRGHGRPHAAGHQRGDHDRGHPDPARPGRLAPHRDHGRRGPVAACAGHGRGHGGDRTGPGRQPQAAPARSGGHRRLRPQPGHGLSPSPGRHHPHGHGVGHAGQRPQARRHHRVQRPHAGGPGRGGGLHRPSPPHRGGRLRHHPRHRGRCPDRPRSGRGQRRVVGWLRGFHLGHRPGVGPTAGPRHRHAPRPPGDFGRGPERRSASAPWSASPAIPSPRP